MNSYTTTSRCSIIFMISFERGILSDHMVMDPKIWLGPMNRGFSICAEDEVQENDGGLYELCGKFSLLLYELSLGF